MLYKFNYAKQSYYDLIVTRNVEPKAKAELGGGGAATTDRRCEAVALATKDESEDGTERSCDARSGMRHVPPAAR